MRPQLGRAPGAGSLVTSLPGTVVGQGAEPAGGLLRMQLVAGELVAWVAEGLGRSCRQLSTGETPEAQEKQWGVEERVTQDPSREC